MDLERIRELVEAAEVSTSATREEAADMLVFGRISQWDDSIGDEVYTEFRGTFDLIKSKRNRILAELWSNPVDITFRAKDGADPDAAETLSGMYRTDMIRNEEAIETALQDQVDCGFGAFRFVTEYESKFDDMNNYQRICAEPISEANNVVYWDANAKKKDKSDAKWCAIVTTYTKHGWEAFAEEHGFDTDIPTPFRLPNTSNASFWHSKQDEVKVAEFYAKEKKRERVFIFEDPLGQTRAVYQRDIKDALDELADMGFIKVGEKMKERFVVTKYIVTGTDILKKQRIPGEHIPVVPIYGDWSRVEGREIWRGIYHDAQDAQRVHNYFMSYSADSVVKGARQKPVFYDGQIQGKEWMWTQQGDSLPYRLVNEISPKTGQAYPKDLITSPPPEVPQAAVAMLEITRRAVDDVTGANLDTEQMLSGQVTEGQITAARKQQNLETFLYQNSFSLAMKQAGRIYASMASELYDVPREVTVTMPDGTESSVMVKESVYDDETGQDVVLNDITKGKFEVYASVGPAFETQKEEARAEMQALFPVLAGTPEGELVLLTYFTLMEGPKTDHLRDYARRKLILQGIIEPETDEEKAMLQQAQQQPQQPDPMMMAALAEMEKAKASQMDAQTKQAQVQVSAYDAETKRAKAMAEIQKIGADTAKIGTEIRGSELDRLQQALGGGNVVGAFDVEERRANIRKLQAEAEAQEIENQMVRSGMKSLIDRLNKAGSSNGQAQRS